MINYIDTELITQQVLTDNSVIDTNISFKYIKPIIKLVQDRDLQPVLGTKLFNRLKEDVYNNRLTGTTIAEDYKFLLDYPIRDVLIYGILAEIQIILSEKIKPKGIVRDVDNYVQLEQYENLKNLRNIYKTQEDFYKNFLSDYLKHNLLKYPEFSESQDLWGVQPDLDNLTQSFPIIFRKKNRLY
jgi:hypothetical protein